jgi:hypothetical protein
MTTHEELEPGSDDTAVLIEFSPGDDPANLSRVRLDGSTVWCADPPQPQNDFWTEAGIDGDTVSAFSWSCYRVRLDLETGAELTRTFAQ